MTHNFQLRRFQTYSNTSSNINYSQNSEGKQILKAQDAINQIFAKKYHQKFKKSHLSYELFIIGVGFNPFNDNHIIFEILIKKYKGNGWPIDEQDSWEEINI